MNPLVYKGSVLARAYALGDSPRSRAAVLRRWRPGHDVWRWGERLVWQLPSPERVACDAAPGLPLVEHLHRLCAAPFTARHLEGAPAGIAAVEGGALVVRPLGAAVDPARWLDVSSFRLAGPALPLGEPPPPPELVFAPRPVTDARTALGMQPLSAEGAAVAEALRTGHTEPAAQAPIRIGPIARALVSTARRLTGWLSRLFARPAAAPPQGSSSNALAPRARPGWLERLEGWLQRVLDVSRLSAVVGRRQADYFARLMQMFEQGDLDAALRHAVPLANETAPAPTRPSLGVPSPRESLDIRLGPRATGAGGYTMSGYYDELRRRYRAAVEKLEREGRYRDAAFVLAELLNAENEAVALLERHGEYRLAAELAEARGLAPGLQVRQWFLARDVARAVAVARRHGVFGDAVSRLQRSNHQAEARQLRLLWADSLASSGDFFNAVATLWEQADARPLTRRWLELGIAQGGHGAVRLEVKRLVLDGAKADTGSALKLLDSDDPELGLHRALLAHEVQAQGRLLDAGVAKSLARATVRTLVREALPAPKELLELAADGALKADLPPERTSDRVRLSSRTPPLRIDVEPWDRGALPVHDAALLPDGRMLLALGEVGARLVARDGRTVAHFDVPAESLVPFDAGGAALCLARRGEVFVTSRLNLLDRTVVPLPQLRLFTFCDGTDGSMWFVHDGQALSGLDLHDARLPALWRVPMPPILGRPQRSGIALGAVPSPAPGELEWWRYELPSLTLRARQQLQLPPVNERVHVAADGNTCVTQGGIAWLQQFSGSSRRQLTGLAGGVITELEGTGDWFSLVARSETGNRWMLADHGGSTVRFVAQLPRTQFNVRMRPDVAVYADAEGRVLAVDLVFGRLMRNLRVR